jgi:hypothetical protein
MGGGSNLTWELLSKDYARPPHTFVFFKGDITRDDAAHSLTAIISWIRNLPEHGIASHLQLALEQEKDVTEVPGDEEIPF